METTSYGGRHELVLEKKKKPALEQLLAEINTGQGEIKASWEKMQAC
jgi:hypothetical protein